MIGVLFLLQTAQVPACAEPALCAILQRAESLNTKAGQTGTGYRASIESEAAMLGRREGRMEAATLVEQTFGLSRWSNSTGLDYHVVGMRSYAGQIPLSRLAFIRIGWIVPTLTGGRMMLVTRHSANVTQLSETLSGALAPEIVVHPLASDREEYYRFEGGTRERRRIELVDREVIVVRVIARGDPRGEQTLFEGELDLDPESYAVVRMTGRFRVFGRPQRSTLVRLTDFEPSITLVDLINQRLANGDWVPAVQRFEVQTASSREFGSGGGRRVIARFHNVEAIPSTGPTEIGASTMGYSVTRATHDSLHRFKGWFTHTGRTTQSVSARDFGSYRPDKLQPTGRPLFSIQGMETKDFLRVNRIEGLFTGVPVIFRFRDAAPGLFLHAKGGYAWKEKEFRGGGRIGLATGKWLVEASGGKSLEVTNKFRNQFDSRALSALVGRDAWDYVGRIEGGPAVTRFLSDHGSLLKLEFARVKDDSVQRHLTKGLLGGGFRPNRNITAGTYWRGKATLDWNPEVSPLYARDGVGFKAEVEHGNGDLDYTRFEGRVVLRKTLTRMFFIARIHAGAVFSDAPPLQQLYEIGGPVGLPGYDYKEFAGDRAVLFRTRLTLPLGLLDLPWRLSSRLTFPALAPAISLGLQGGYTDTRNAAGTTAVRALGDKYDYKTGDPILDDNGDPLPASIVTDKLKTSIDLRVGFFGDALAVGLARALEKGRHIRFLFAFGRQF